MVQRNKAGCVLASSVCAQKLAGWVVSVVSMSRNPIVELCIVFQIQGA